MNIKTIMKIIIDVIKVIITGLSREFGNEKLLFYIRIARFAC